MKESARIGDSRIETLKVPPHSVQAEQSVLGGLVLDNDSWDTVADRVGEEDFYRRDHRLIFRAIAKLVGEQKPFDVVTLSEWLEQTGELDAEITPIENHNLGMPVMLMRMILEFAPVVNFPGFPRQRVPGACGQK